MRLYFIALIVSFLAWGAVADPTQDQVDDLRQTIRDLEDQAQAIKDASDDPTIETLARAIEREALVAKTLGVELDRLINDDDPTEPPIILPPDPPIDSSGWLAPEPDADAIRLNAGTTEAQARAAFNSARDVLFEAGSIYNFSLGELWRSGSLGDPRLIGVYGDGPRPQFVVSSTWVSTKAGNNVHDIVIVGLRLSNAGRVPPDIDPGAEEKTALSWLAEGDNVLIEDCVFEGFKFGISIEPLDDDELKVLNHLTINRCIFRDIWSTGDSSGLRVKAAENAQLLDCVFDLCGWMPGHAQRDLRSHCVYLSPRPNDLDDTRAFPWIVRGNLFSRGASHGMKGGTGGVVEENVWLHNAIAFYVSRNDSIVRNNFVGFAQDIGTTNALARAWGFEALGSIDVVVEGNVVCNPESFRPEASAAFAIKANGQLSGNHVYAQPRGSGSAVGVTYHSERLDVDLGSLVEDERNRARGVWLGGISDFLDENL